MAFTEEQEKAILEFVTKGSTAQTAADKAAADAAAADKDKNKSGDDAGKKSIAQEARDAVDAEKNAASALSQIQESVKFNMGVESFIEKNKNLLPDEATKILTTIATKTFKDDNEKANAVRQNLLDSFLSQKDNISVLTASMQARAEQYKALAESDKARRSAEFWDLAEVGIALKAGARKAEALNKINGINNTGDSSGNILEDKFMAAARKKFNNENK